jgi:hypothetical protein
MNTRRIYMCKQSALSSIQHSSGNINFSPLFPLFVVPMTSFLDYYHQQIGSVIICFLYNAVFMKDSGPTYAETGQNIILLSIKYKI